MAGQPAWLKGEGKNMEDVSFRYATEADVPLIMSFINAMAVYEKMADQVVVTEELVRESIFLGRAGLYLEDLFVLPEYRGKGYGKALLRQLARIAVERNYGRFEWICLDWNQPSIDFYLSVGAKPLDGWTIYRLTGETLKAFAEGE